MRDALVEERLTHSAIGAFFDVHNELRFGFHESIYGMALERELLARGHRVSREFGVMVRYKGHELAYQRLDMVVDDRLVIEIKATERLHRNALRQLYGYLKATNLEVGLLLHFSPSGARFYRQIHTRDRKQFVGRRAFMNGNPTDSTDHTDQSV